MNREDILSLFEKHQTIPYHPKKKPLREGTILDENQSVKWNREQVELSKKEYDAELKKLRKQHSEIERHALNAVYSYIQDNLCHQFFSTEKCAILYSKAYERGHSAGYQEVMNYVDEYIDFLNDMMS